MKKRKMWKKALSVLLVLSMVLMGASGCSQQKRTSQVKIKKQTGKIQLGLSFDSFVIERWVRDRDTFEINAKELGADVNVQNANGDRDRQVEQINYLIKKGMDAIVVIASDCSYSKLTQVIQKAKEAGITILSYDRFLKNVDSDLYLSFDNEQVGKLMAKELIKKNPKGGVVFEIDGSGTDSNVALVKKGFGETIKDSKLHIAYEAYCKQWEAEYGAEYVEKALKKYPDVVGIMCGNDDIASQAAKVLSENRLLGKVSLVGQDADLLACQRIVEGTQDMTVYKQVEKLAKAAAYFAVRLVKKQDITKDTDLNGDGKMDGYYTKEYVYEGKKKIPSYTIPVDAVVKSNIDHIIIDGGFHTREDVYLNVAK